MIKKVTPTGNLDQENDIPFIKDGDYRDALDVTSISDSNGNTISWEPKTQNQYAFNLGAGAGLTTNVNWTIDFTNCSTVTGSSITINVYRPGGLLVNGYVLYIDSFYAGSVPSILASNLDLSIKGQKATTVLSVTNTSGGLSDVTYQITAPNGGNSFRIGQLVNTTGFTGTGYNVTKAVVTAVTATTFTVRVTTPSGPAGTGYCIGAADGSVTSSIDVNNSNKVLYTFQTAYPWDFYITSSDPGVVLIKENDAIDSSMTGPFRMCGGMDLLGDLFIMSTSSTQQQSELTITVAGNTTATRGLYIIIDKAHGLSVNETVYIYGVSAGGYSVQPEWLVETVFESNPGSGIYDGFSVYGGEFELFATGLNNYLISGAITLSSFAKVVKNPKTLSRISVATEDKDSGVISCTHLLTTSSLNFRLHNRIHLHCEDEGFRKSFYWCDGLNKDRAMYYTKSDYSTGGFLISNGGIYNLSDITDSTTLSISQANIDFTLNSVKESGGSLKSGNYRYAIRFLNKFFAASEWSDLTNIINIYSASFSNDNRVGGDQDGTTTSKSVVFSVSGVPDIYKYYEIAYVRYSNNSYFADAFRGNISSTSFNVTHTGKEVSVDFNVDDLNKQNSFYETSHSITSLDNRLIRSNLIAEDVPDFSGFFKSWKHAIKRQTLPSAVKTITAPWWDGQSVAEYMDPMNVHNKKTFMPNETYRFSGRVKLKNGRVVNQNFWIDDISIDGNSINIGNLAAPTRRNSSSTYQGSLSVTDASRNPYVYYVSFESINWDFEINGKRVRDIIDSVYIDYVEMTEQYQEVLASGITVMSSASQEDISQNTETGLIKYGQNSSGNTDWGPFTGNYTMARWGNASGGTRRKYSVGLRNINFAQSSGSVPSGWTIESSTLTYTAPAGGNPGYLTSSAGILCRFYQSPTATEKLYLDGRESWLLIKITGQTFSATATAVGTTVTFTTTVNPHAFPVGAKFTASGFNNVSANNWNGSYTVTAATGTTITATAAAAPTGTPNTGSITLTSFPAATSDFIRLETTNVAPVVGINFQYAGDLNGNNTGSYGDMGYYAAPFNVAYTNLVLLRILFYSIPCRVNVVEACTVNKTTSTAYDAVSERLAHDDFDGTINRKAGFFISPDIYQNQASISYLSGDQMLSFPTETKTFEQTNIGSAGSGGCAFHSVYQEYHHKTYSDSLGYVLQNTISGAKEIQPFGRETVGSYILSNNTRYKINNYDTNEYYTTPKCIGVTFSSDLFEGLIFDSGIASSFYYRNKGRGAKFQGVTTSSYVYSGFKKNSFDTNNMDVYGDCFVQNTFVKLRTPATGVYSGGGGYTVWGAGYGIGMYSYNRGNYQMEYPADTTLGLPRVAGPVPWLEKKLILFGSYTNGYSNRFDIKYTNAYDPDVQTGNVFPTRICYSNTKQNGSFSDDYRTFELLNFRDLDLSDGEIVHHDIFNGELLTWQPRSFQRQFFNSSGLIPSSNGMDVVVGDAGALTRRGNQISSIGTSHKWSVIRGKSRGGDDMFAWINTETGDFARFGSDGTVPISQVQSMMSSLRDKIKWADKKYTPSHDLGINGVWDDTNKSFHFVSRGVRNTHGIWNSNTTYVAPATGGLYVYLYVGSSITPRVFRLINGLTSVNENPTTNPSVWQEVFDYSIFNIDYSMIKSGFQSFHSWCPKTMLRWGRTFVSARPGYQESDIFIHNRGGTQYAYPGGGQIATNPYITPVCVLDPNMKTTYEAIELNSSALPSRIDFTTDQHISYLLSSDFEQDEIHDNLWAAPIKNDSTVDANNPTGSNEIDTSNLFGKHLFVKYTFPSASKSKLFNFIIKLTPMSRLNNS